MKVYLAGIIDGTNIDKCKEWRTKIITHYTNWKNTGKNYGDICFLNPLNGEDQISDDGLSSHLPGKAILTKDYNAIKKCDLFIVNMDTFGVARPPIGTIMEIAFAYEFKKPVMMITTEELYKKHPFISNMVDWYFDSVDDMLNQKAINIFYKAWHSAPH
ncbi:MAG: nucleoside 2-deoxyribosyltransferase [Candidatus Woesearchaeota archaeon]